MPPDLPPLVQRTLRRLIRAFSPERIVLFGSYAKGTVHDRSDVDLLVIANLEGNPAFHQRRARQQAADCFPPIDVVFATPADVTGAASAKSPFLLTILRSGITIYTRPCRLAERAWGLRDPCDERGIAASPECFRWPAAQCVRSRREHHCRGRRDRTEIGCRSWRTGSESFRIRGRWRVNRHPVLGCRRSE